MFPLVLLATLGVGLTLIAEGANPLWSVAAPLAFTVVVIAIGERVIPMYASWNRPRGDVLTDVIHLGVSNLSLPELYRVGLVLALAPAADWVTPEGLSPWPHDEAIGIQLGMALVLGEFGQYWAHRWSHEHDLLWRLHSTHHSPRRLYWLNAGRDHPLGVAWLYLPSLSPLIVLGAPEEVFHAYALFTGVHGLFQHANLDLRLGPLNWVFSMAELHRWHHHLDTEHANHNYGANLILWDIAFGTWYLPDELPPEDVGIGDMPTFPTDYLGQLAVPFRWKNLRGSAAGSPGGDGATS
jgi:sterol desaturase/sphingolipid hydroxylase (fatty acid hydroxylase superfamily)